jgi:heat shock protein HslJ
MDLRTSVLVVTIVVGGATLASCGSGDEPVTSGDGARSLAGDYLATDITEDGDPRPLVDGTQISLRLEDGQLSARAGCNHIGGSYVVEDGVLRVEALSMTEMGCDEQRSAQDAFVAEFVSAAPIVEVADDGFVLRSDAASITFVDRSVVEPDVDLAGTTWVVDTFVDGAGPDGTSSARDGPMGTFTFGTSGVVEGSDGCNDFSGLGYEVAGDTITFDPVSEVTSTAIGCPQMDTDPFWAVFSAGAAEFSIDGDRLTLTAGTRGLRAEASGT